MKFKLILSTFLLLFMQWGYAATYQDADGSAPAEIVLEHVQLGTFYGLGSPVSALLRSTDTASIHVGQTFVIDGLTEVEADNPDSFFSDITSELSIRLLNQSESVSYNVVLLLTDADAMEFSVIRLASYAVDENGERSVVIQAGPQGEQGIPGPAGAGGAQGPQGLAGLGGVQGMQGPQGPQGDPGPQGPAGATGHVGPHGPIGPQGPQGPQGDIGPEGPEGPAGQVMAFANFYATMPPYNAATVAPGTDIEFPLGGPRSGHGIFWLWADAFRLEAIGFYEVSWQVSISEAGQLVLTLNGNELNYTVAGRDANDTQITNTVLIQTTTIDSVLTLRNPAGNSTALTVTPLAGGTHPVSASLTIKQIQ